ncbi:hypothetical protein LTR37_001043 [Vermiconidia calcicola]|uniref:Uncharacterized protein n=1 Tax=Vermiconidia calcicola TaxID=1690605 RepID=A0ACC3NZB7_9PEZI|nr:hypothetical protein LTR37_001043 [Vermiconidia calcicola]
MSKPRARKHVEEYESDDGFVEDAPKNKKQNKTVNEMQTDDEGNEYWELSGKRRVQVSDFKGMTMVGIREFYNDKESKSLPGKKGIALTLDQYTAFLGLVPEIERVLKSKGITVPRPQYESQPATKDEEPAADEVDEDGDEDEEASTHKGKLDKFKMKKNHETTSDEEE